MAHLIVSLGLLLGTPAFAEEPDHEIHEALREMVREVTAEVDDGNYLGVLPYLTDDFEGTLLNQAPVTGHQGVTDYFDLWFGDGGYMASVSMEVLPDTLTQLSDDKTWGLVKGAGREHYVAKNGDVFDFDSRWTAVVVLDDDGEWRVRAIHFGTNHLDNPVLWKVRDSMIWYGGIGATVLCFLTFWMGWFMGRHRKTT